MYVTEKGFSQIDNDIYQGILPVMSGASLFVDHAVFDQCSLYGPQCTPTGSHGAPLPPPPPAVVIESPLPEGIPNVNGTVQGGGRKATPPALAPDKKAAEGGSKSGTQWRRTILLITEPKLNESLWVSTGPIASCHCSGGSRDPLILPIPDYDDSCPE